MEIRVRGGGAFHRMIELQYLRAAFGQLQIEADIHANPDGQDTIAVQRNRRQDIAAIRVIADPGFGHAGHGPWAHHFNQAQYVRLPDTVRRGRKGFSGVAGLAAGGYWPVTSSASACAACRQLKVLQHARTRCGEAVGIVAVAGRMAIHRADQGIEIGFDVATYYSVLLFVRWKKRSGDMKCHVRRAEIIRGAALRDDHRRAAGNRLQHRQVEALGPVGRDVSIGDAIEGSQLRPG